MSLPPFLMRPFLTPRPWGGTHLPVLFDETVDSPIGEAWSLSDRPEGPSRVQGGPLDGMLFGDVIRRFPQEAIGLSKPPAHYPLLVKFIDAAEDLSIQVHPDDAYTQKNGLPDRGKTECWYVMKCRPGAEIIYGLKEGMTRSLLEDTIANGTVADAVRRIPISPGTFLFVPPGTIHAILGGTLLCEIQQSSDLTFRLWDWNRKPPRQLHIQESLEVVRFDTHDQPEPLVLPPYSSGTESPLLTSNEFFEVRAVRISQGNRHVVSQAGKGLILNGVEGECTIDGITLTPGGTLFVPACIPGVVLQANKENATVLISRSLE